MAIQKKALLWTTAAALGLMSAGAYAGNQCPPNPTAATDFKVFISTNVAGDCYDYGQTNVSGLNGVKFVDTSVAPYNTLAGRTDDADGDGRADSGPPYSDAAKFLQLASDGTALLGDIPDYAGGSQSNGLLTINQTFSSGTEVRGTWSVTPGLIAGPFVLLLKTGNKLDPIWAAFEFAAGTVGGDWKVACTTTDSSGCGLGLSHASLYGQVPLPAAAWLLLSGLVGLFGISRRRGTVAA